MKSALDNSLHELRQQISRSKLSPRERDDLHDALESLAHSLDDESVDSFDLATSIRNRLIDFQDSHPVLMRSINQVADTLAQMGI